MEALNLPTVTALRPPRETNGGKSLAKFKYPNPLKPLSLIPLLGRPRSHYSHRLAAGVRAEYGEDEHSKQMQEMNAAKKRWEALIREGKIKILTPKEAGYAVRLSNKTLLDVRPSTEYEKAWVKGSPWIPIFDVDSTITAGSIPKNITNFVMGGWWNGSPVLSYNSQFLQKVEEQFPRDIELIVACQKGLRSLAACEQLLKVGYENIFWVQGGLEAAEEEDFQREGSQPFKLAGIGGFSEFLGWTDQQRAQAAKEGWGYRFVFSARLAGLVILADALFIGAQQFGPYLQHLRSN
ncbi:hypothetical protein QJS10_CPB18g00620 [Acorus calamus]|uniref:Rhodanese domain-containing protein n=1 Tax=Acorus calamus TaxID=4465 RepID=A0AAV9CL11_ACOCL|nr:hypothetical protein QJS10_CPB18g00620 [Acorus calamus]